MTWLKMIPYAVAIVGCLATYVMYKRAKSLRAERDALRSKVTSLTMNLQILRESEVNDAHSQKVIQKITEDIKNAKTDEDAASIRADFVDVVSGGLSDMWGRLPGGTNSDS